MAGGRPQSPRRSRPRPEDRASFQRLDRRTDILSIGIRGVRRSPQAVVRDNAAQFPLEARRIDFFNEELMKFLSFNNAVLASIEDVIIVSDAQAVSFIRTRGQAAGEI